MEAVISTICRTPRSMALLVDPFRVQGVSVWCTCLINITKKRPNRNTNSVQSVEAKKVKVLSTRIGCAVQTDLFWTPLSEQKSAKGRVGGAPGGEGAQSPNLSDSSSQPLGRGRIGFIAGGIFQGTQQAVQWWHERSSTFKLQMESSASLQLFARGRCEPASMDSVQGLGLRTRDSGVLGG